MNTLLDKLHCPFCGGKLRSSKTVGARELRYDVLTCYCSQYPVVAGIPILRRGVIASGGRTAEDVIAMIETGRHREALSAMLMPSVSSADLAPAWMQALPAVKGIGRLRGLMGRAALRRWQEQAVPLLTNDGSQTTVLDVLDFYFRRRGNHDLYNYYAFRLGQPRHFVALSFASLIDTPKKPILDLACGVGHITRHLLYRAQGQMVVGVDLHFFSLYVAKTWIAPEADYVCSDASISLPFPDGAFSTVFCTDAFQCFDQKLACIRELKRVIQSDGLIVLVALRNMQAKRHLRTIRLSLPPEGYEALVADMPHRLVANSSVLERYLRKQGPPLACSANKDLLVDEQWLSIVASRRQDLWRDYGPFADWPHAEGKLHLNPLYREQKTDELGKLHLRRVFPSVLYEEEDGECRQYEPETISVSSQGIHDIASGQRTPEVEALIGQGVVLGMPERFRSTV